MSRHVRPLVQIYLLIQTTAFLRNINLLLLQPGLICQKCVASVLSMCKSSLQIMPKKTFLSQINLRKIK